MNIKLCISYDNKNIYAYSSTLSPFYVKFPSKFYRQGYRKMNIRAILTKMINNAEFTMSNIKQEVNELYYFELHFLIKHTNPTYKPFTLKLLLSQCGDAVPFEDEDDYDLWFYSRAHKSLC